METVKKQVLELIQSLPDNVGYDDIMAEIYFKEKVDKSLDQIEQGQILSHNEVKEKMSPWLK